MNTNNPIFMVDSYKLGHHLMYPEGTTLVYSNLTPRANKYAPKGIDKVVSFGQQAVIAWLNEEFQQKFFNRPKDEVISEIKKEISQHLSKDYDTSHFEALHDLGYLPICVKSLPEGVEVPMKVPVLTIYNTIPEFFWVTNFLETILSNMLWLPMTSATIALHYRRILEKWAKKTNPEAIGFVAAAQGHDFSMRGMGGISSTILSGMGHGIVFRGSDNIPAIGALRQYYHAKGTVLTSVNATEHSVMCAGSKESELETFERLLDTFPNEVISVVSDTWNLWDVLTKHLPTLKEKIERRSLPLVIRPDSGDPVDILCGIKDMYEVEKFNGYVEYEKLRKGVIELLWDTFGGIVNEQGYKVLAPCIGAIYGDSITPERAEEICRRLEQKGFASTNVVLGIGSYTYQYKTRDTFALAMKATYVEREEIVFDIETEYGQHNPVSRTVGQPIFKDPVTDDGTKKSATGLLKVERRGGEYALVDNVTWNDEALGRLKILYYNGEVYNHTTYNEIVENINSIV